MSKSSWTDKTDTGYRQVDRRSRREAARGLVVVLAVGLAITAITAWRRPVPIATMRARAAGVGVDTGYRVSINEADAAELNLLPGLGRILSDTVVTDRTRRGPFEHLDNLTRVRGIGAKTVEKLRPYATVDQPD